MNSFKIFVYDNLAKTWSEIPNVAFPLGTGDYLDERLDECYVTFYDGKEHYTSSTVFKILPSENGTEGVPLYYVLDNDSSIELPTGSGRYKHQLHLLEPTKLTEGVLCQTITFTNDLGNDSISNLGYATPEVKNSFTDVSSVIGNYNFGIPGVVRTGQTIVLPSIREVTSVFVQSLIEVSSTLYEYGPYYNEVSGKKPELRIYYGDTEPAITITDTYTKQEISAKPNLKIEYDIGYWLTFKLESTGTTYHYLPTLTFTPTVLAIHYPLKPYTVTGMIMRCLELAEPLFLTSSTAPLPRFGFDGLTYNQTDYTTEEGSQAEKYDKIRADELTLTKATLREQLKTIGRSIHAEPRIVVSEKAVESQDENGNEVTLYDLVFTLKYDEYGEVTEAESLKDKPYSYRALNQSINEYCTEIRTSASNLVNALDYGVGVIEDPVSGRSLRADSSNVRIESGNGIAETAFPIYKIISVFCGIIDPATGTTIRSLNDITAYVVEKAQYDLYNPADNAYPNSKSLALYYTQGQPNIGGLFYIAQTASKEEGWFKYYSIVNILAQIWSVKATVINNAIETYGEASLVFHITYIPMYSTSITQSKMLYTPGAIPFAQIYNQGENIIEARYFGENVKGAAARLGNVSEERTYLLSKRADIPKCGQMISGYSIAAVSAEMMPLYYKCTIALSKDFNRINEYVGISSHKRIYQVSEREAYDRDVIINEKIVFSKTALKSNPSRVLRKLDAVFGGIANVNYPSPPIRSVIAATKRKGLTPEKIGTVCLPVISSAFGNAMIFTWKYKDNFSAGSSSEERKVGDVSGRWMIENAYGDYFGRAYYYDFSLYRLLPVGLINNYLPFELPKIDPEKVNYKSAIVTTFSNGVQSGSSGPYILRKDSRERISTVNYEIEFLTTEPDIIIGSGMAAANHLVNAENKKFIFYALKKPVRKFQRTIDISDLYYYGTEDIDDPEIYSQLNLDSIAFDSESSQIIFPKNSSVQGLKNVYWALATQIETKIEGPFEDEDGLTSYLTREIGGEIILASTEICGAVGEPIHAPLYVSIQK